MIDIAESLSRPGSNLASRVLRRFSASNRPEYFAKYVCLSVCYYGKSLEREEHERIEQKCNQRCWQEPKYAGLNVHIVVPAQTIFVLVCVERVVFRIIESDG